MMHFLANVFAGLGGRLVSTTFLLCSSFLCTFFRDELTSLHFQVFKIVVSAKMAICNRIVTYSRQNV